MSKPGHTSRLEWIRSALDRFEGPLVRYARGILRDGDQARDVAQETFLRLCRTDRTEIDGHLAQWLFTVCRNLALDVKRKEQRMSTLSESGQSELEGREPMPEDVAQRRDDAGQVAEFMERLPDNQQEVIRLKFQNGLSYKEIANVTGLTVTNVGFLLHRGLATLRQQLASEGV